MLFGLTSWCGSTAGWDTDQFPMDVKKATLAMLVVLKQEGLAPGGLNFDCKVSACGCGFDGAAEASAKSDCL